MPIFIVLLAICGHALAKPGSGAAGNDNGNGNGVDNTTESSTNSKDHHNTDIHDNQVAVVVSCSLNPEGAGGHGGGEAAGSETGEAAAAGGAEGAEGRGGAEGPR